MDVIQIIKPKILPLKASYDKLTIKSKLGVLILLISLSSISIPHQTFAETKPNSIDIIFEVGDYEDFLLNKTLAAEEAYRYELLLKQAQKKQELARKLQQYLADNKSPMANHVETLLSLPYWKKVIALSNAESSFCRKAPGVGNIPDPHEGRNNCWGVGGSNLWDMGPTLDDGLKGMNSFLMTHPKRGIKYSAMSFENMNGFYKQPAADHWLTNTKVIYDELTALEQG